MPQLVRAITRIQDGDDVPVLGAGQNGYALTWDNATGRFVATALSSGSGSPGGATTQVQYNAAGAFAGDAGLTYDAVADALTVVGRVVTPAIRPAVDSTTAIQLQNATGTAIVTLDTTNNRLGIAVSPIFPLDVQGAGADGASIAKFHRGGTEKAAYISSGNGNVYHSSEGGLEFRTGVTANDPLGTGVATMNLNANGYTTFNGLRVSGADGLNTIYQNAMISITTGGGGTQGVSIDNSGNVNIRDSASNSRLYVKTTGGVGIDNAAPTAALDLPASTTARASLRLRSGVAPTTPNDGDVWFDGAALFVRIGGVTKTVTVT